MLFKVSLVLAVCLSAVPFAAGTCIGLQSLESEIQARPSAALYVELANWFEDHHQYPCAIKTLRAGLRFDPTSGDLSYLLGLAFDSTGHPKDAIAPLQQAIRVTPRDIELHLLLGTVFDELKQNNKAAVQFESAIGIDPLSVDALHGLCKVLIAERNYSAVIKLLRSAHDNEILALDLGQAYDKAGMYDPAVRVLAPVLHRDPSSFRLAHALVTVYVDQKRYQDAAYLAEKSLGLHPKMVEAQNLYLSTLVLNRDFDKARPLAQMLLAAHPHDFEAVYMDGILESKAGRYRIASQRLEEAVLLNPTDFNARYNLGIMLAELKDFSGATQQWEASLTLGAGASEPQVRYRLANALRMLGENEEAKKQFRLTKEELQIMANKSLHRPIQGC